MHSRAKRKGTTARRKDLVTLLLHCAISCSLLAGVAGPAHAANDTKTIYNVTLVDAKLGVRSGYTVDIAGENIRSLSPTTRAEPPPGAIDGTGLFLTPGLWDMHVHLTYDPELTDAMAALFLHHGITSVRDTGGLLDQILPVVHEWRKGIAPAPRVFFSGPLLDGEPVVYDGGPVPQIGRGQTTTENARARVDALAAAGVDFIKIYELVTPEIFNALVDQAARHQLPVAAHVPLSMLASDAGPQVDSMEHLRNVEFDCAAGANTLLADRRDLLAAGRADGSKGLALRSAIHKAQRQFAIANEDQDRCTEVLTQLQHTIQVPTSRLNAMTRFPPFERRGWNAALAMLPIPVRDSWAQAPSQMSYNEDFARLADWTLAMIPRLLAANVPIGAGTDTPIGWAVPGFSLHSELEVLVAAGLSPRQALAAATVIPAGFFGLEGNMGSIAPGQAADLLLLEGNPLEDIRNTRRIRAVMSRGAWIEAPQTQ